VYRGILPYTDDSKSTIDEEWAFDGLDKESEEEETGLKYDYFAGQFYNPSQSSAVDVDPEDELMIINVFSYSKRLLKELGWFSN